MKPLWGTGIIPGCVPMVALTYLSCATVAQDRPGREIYRYKQVALFYSVISVVQALCAEPHDGYTSVSPPMAV